MNASGEWDKTALISHFVASAWHEKVTVLLFSDERNQSNSRVRYIVIVSFNIEVGNFFIFYFLISFAILLDCMQYNVDIIYKLQRNIIKYKHYL